MHRHQIINYALLVLAVISSAIAFYALFRLAECEFYTFYKFLPASLQVHEYGSEGGMIEFALDLIFGGSASFIALLFASIHFFRNRNIKSARLLLGWCCFLVLGFLAMFVYDLLDYFKVQAAHI